MRKILEGFNFKAPAYLFNSDDFVTMEKTLGIDLSDDNKTDLQRACTKYLYFEAAWKTAASIKDVREILTDVHKDVVRLMNTLHSLHGADTSDRPASDKFALGNPAQQSALQLLLNFAPENYWSRDYHDEMLAYAEKVVKLAKEPDSSDQKLELEMVFASAPDKGWSENDSGEMFAFIGRLAELGRAAIVALEENPGNKGGRPDDLPFNTLCKTLMDLFAEITNVGPTVTTDSYNKSSDEEFSGNCINFVESFLSPLHQYYQKSPRELGLILKVIIGKHKRH